MFIEQPIASAGIFSSLTGVIVAVVVGSSDGFSFVDGYCCVVVSLVKIVSVVKWVIVMLFVVMRILL